MRWIMRAGLFAGVPVSVLCMLGTAAALTVLELPLHLYPVFAAVPVLCGCFAAGHSAGRGRRSHGIGTGTGAALTVTALWYAAAFVLTGRAGIPVILLAALPCGICGGICGVNTKLPLPHRRAHGLRAVRTRAGMLPLLLHRPEEKQQPDPESGRPFMR